MDILAALKEERIKIERKLSAINNAIVALNGSGKTVRVQAERTGRKFTMSASARRRIGLATKRRWAAFRAEKNARPRRVVMSAATKRKISIAQRNRFAAKAK